MGSKIRPSYCVGFTFRANFTGDVQNPTTFIGSYYTLEKALKSLSPILQDYFNECTLIDNYMVVLLSDSTEPDEMAFIGIYLKYEAVTILQMELNVETF